MIYSENEILQYIDENDVKFVKLTFCDINGKMKNISILSSELAVTFERGARLTAKKIKGFESADGRDLFLFPVTVLPWRPQILSQAGCCDIAPDDRGENISLNSFIIKAEILFSLSRIKR